MYWSRKKISLKIRSYVTFLGKGKYSITLIIIGLGIETALYVTLEDADAMIKKFHPEIILYWSPLKRCILIFWKCLRMTIVKVLLYNFGWLGRTRNFILMFFVMMEMQNQCLSLTVIGRGFLRPLTSAYKKRGSVLMK